MTIAQLDRKKRDVLLRKADILKAAEHVFAVKGFYRATMADIAEEAQYGVGTLYLYFKDKQSLYISLFEEKMKELLRLVKKKAEESNNALEKIKSLINTQLDFFSVNENFFRIFFNIREGLHWKIKGDVSTSVVQLIFKLMDDISDIIKQAQSHGVIKKEYSPKKVAYILQSIIRSIIIPRLLQEEKNKEDISDQGDFILEVLLKGVGAK